MKMKTNALFQLWFCSSIYHSCTLQLLYCTLLCVFLLFPYSGTFVSFFRDIKHSRIPYFRLFICSLHCYFVTHNTEASAIQWSWTRIKWRPGHDDRTKWRGYGWISRMIFKLELRNASKFSSRNLLLSSMKSNFVIWQKLWRQNRQKSQFYL